MATNIMSLFNTEDSFAPQQQAFQQRLMQATDPRAFIAAVGGNMGAQLGQAVPGLLGMPNKQQKVRRIMQAVGSISDPLGQAKEAYKLFQQEGMPQEAQAVLQSIQELQKESDANVREAAKLKARETLASSLSTLDPSSPEDQLKLATLAAQAGEGSMAGTAFTAAGSLKKTKAEKEAETQSAKNRTKAVKGIQKDIAQDVADMIGADKGIFAKFLDATILAKDEKNKTEIKTVGDTVKLITYNPINGNVVRTQNLGAAPKPAKTEITIDQRGLGKYAEIVGSKVAEKDVGIVTVAETAAESMPKIKDTLDVLRKTKDGPITGIGAEILLNFERVKAKLLKDKGSIEKVKNTELLDAFLGSEVFPMITALGIGARGLDTPAEREFLRGVFTGTIAMSNATLIEMTEIRERIAQRAVDKYNKKLSEGYFKNYEKAQDRKLNPITFGTVTTTNWEPN
jgi:hypothetical protein